MSMKNSISVFIFSFSMCLLTGCIHVPQTLIKGDMNKGTFSIAAPKDGTLEGFQLVRLTNGTLQITVQRHTVRMNPDVIQQTAAGQAQIIQATAQGVGAALGEALKQVAPVPK
jgi:starvation-inducible outer membrane lipoprotein